MILLLATALACVDCHKSIVEAYARTPMANTSGVVRARDERPGTVGRLRIEQGATLRLSHERGGVDLTVFIGSRRMGRSFAFPYLDHLYQAPVGYYATRNAWDFAPGYERDVAPDFTRPITTECLFCHATSAKLAPASVNRYTEIVHGIQCERCHGDVTSHDKLVNPAKLAPRLRDSVCEQCHLSGEVRLAQPGRTMQDFRPGGNLADYVEVWIDAPRGLRVNSHAEALGMSKCKQAAGDKLWCGSCHNPHRPTDYNATCRTCHAQPHSKGDCVSCHMKKGRPEDGGHTVFTDHTIAAGKVAGTAPMSYFKRAATPRNHGLALAALAMRDRDPALLEKAWPLLRIAAASGPRDPLLYNTIAALLIADGRRDQAIDYYRLSLQQDPVQPDVLKKLAAIVGNAEAIQLRKQADKMLPTPKL